MFVSADNECAGLPNSQDPASSAAVASSSASAQAYYDQMLQNANSDWLSLLSRSWQSYASLGPQVGIQLLNGQPKINAVSLATGVIISDPVGTTETGTTGGNPATGPNGGLTSDDIAFSKYFGNKPRFKTYTGKLPSPGSSMSLVMGGQNRNLPVGPGRYPASTPDQRFGYGQQCGASPTGVVTDAASSVSPVAGTSGVVLAVLGLLALAGLGYAVEHKKARGRR